MNRAPEHSDPQYFEYIDDKGKRCLDVEAWAEAIRVGFLNAYSRGNIETNNEQSIESMCKTKQDIKQHT